MRVYLFGYMIRWILKKILKYVFFALVVFLVLSFFFALRASKKTPLLYGVTFAPRAAEDLGLDWKKAYVDMFDELRVRHIRVSAYWSDIEREDDVVDFEKLDFQVAEAEKRGAELIVAVGRKVPRWPECHIPEWAKSLDYAEQDIELFEHMERVVTRYKNSPAVKIWQVENEPFLPFGLCPPANAESLDAGIALVRSLDSRPILTTDSGELSLWVRAARRGDIFGTTMYRTIWNKFVGQFEYPVPPAFFRAKRGWAEFLVGQKPMIVIELQGEPWLSKPIYETTIEEHYTVMSPEEFKRTLAYAEASGFDTFYLWGVEWWYWLKTQGHPEIWEMAKRKIADPTVSL